MMDPDVDETGESDRVSTGTDTEGDGTRAVVQCEACGRPYAARIIDGEVILPTRGGTCRCGHDTFVRPPIEVGPSVG